MDAHNGVVFPSWAWHMQMPWQGRKYILVCFKQVSLANVAPEDLVLLRKVGFRLCAGWDST